MGALEALAGISNLLSQTGGGGDAYQNVGVYGSKYVSSNDLKDAASSYKSVNLPQLFGRVKTLAEKAREGILMYPMLLSESIRELGILPSICKYQELQYALFTMVVAGFNPIAMRGITRVGDYINMTLAAESVSPEVMKDADNPDVKYAIESPKKVDVDRATQLVTDSMAAYDFGDERDDMSLEATFSSAAPRRVVTAAPGATPGQFSNPISSPAKQSGDKMEKSVYKSRDAIDQIEAKKGPTIVNLRVVIQDREVVVPIIVKVVPHLLESTEIKSLFEVSLQDKNWLQRWIKLTTGEISFFKDFVLQMDLAKKNAELYKKLGRHPWIKNLEHRKMLSLINDKFMSDVAHTEIMPTATIVATKDEISEATKLSPQFILSHPELIYKVVDKLFLMALIVYDPDMEIFSIYYAGYTKPILYTLSEIHKADSDPSRDLIKIISNLSSKV